MTIRVGWVILASVLGFAGSSGECAGRYDRYGLYGVGHPAGGHLLGNPPDYEDMVWRRIAEAGATSVRQAASWREIEAARGSYDWTQVESTLKYCRKYPRIRPYLLVVNTPGWARADGKPSHLPPVPSAIPDWKRFCRALAEHYRGFVDHYEIWNEQNGFGWEVPPYNQFDKYLPILEAAYEGIKQGNPKAIVSLGGLDDAAGNSPIFTKGSYQLRLTDYGNRRIWDAFGDHPYGDTKSMLAKLRAIKGIAAGYGDGDLELWLTEYGFHSGEMSKEEQAKALSDYMTTLITDPELRYVTETNYLCVADFEETTHGFGLCDANLRPRPAFRAYQRLPRPGSVVIHDINVRHLSPTSIAVDWQTDVPSSGSISIAEGKGALKQAGASAGLAKTHSVTLTGLKPHTSYTYAISARADGLPEAATLDYEFTTLAPRGLRNQGFEEGFSVEIAKHWECVGDNLCWDSARLPDEGLRLAHSGKHAQCVVANGKWGDGLDDAVAAQASVAVGKEVTFSVWTRASSDGNDSGIMRRVGIDPTGGLDPRSPGVVWSEPDAQMGKWSRQSVKAVPQAPVVTVFAHALTTKKGKARDFFYVDDASLE